MQANYATKKLPAYLISSCSSPLEFHWAGEDRKEDLKLWLEHQQDEARSTGKPRESGWLPQFPQTYLGTAMLAILLGMSRCNEMIPIALRTKGINQVYTSNLVFEFSCKKETYNRFFEVSWKTCTTRKSSIMMKRAWDREKSASESIGWLLKQCKNMALWNTRFAQVLDINTVRASKYQKLVIKVKIFILIW